MGQLSDHVLDDRLEQEWPKVCNICKASYDVDAWERLPYKGLTKLAEEFGLNADLEYRTCTGCGDLMTQSTVPREEILRVKLS